MKKILALTLAGFVFLGCSNKSYSPILVERGVQDYERKYYAEQESYGVDPSLVDIFLKGYVAEGMTQEMVRLLWGPPDRDNKEGTIWEYVTREGNIITRVRFDKEVTRLRGITEKVVTEILDDRYGGSAPPSN